MAKKEEEKIDIFGSAKVKIKGSKPKDDKEVIYIDGLEPKLLELEFLKAQIKDLEAQLGGVADEIKNISKEKFVELYKIKKSNPNTFLIKDGEGCVMVIPTDRYISIKDEDRVNQLIEEYGDDIITTDGQWVFNSEVLKRNIDAIKQLLMDAKTISNEDKKNLLVNEKSYSISKGYIDKLAQYGSKIGTVLDDIQPVINLKNCGGKMEEGGMMGDDFIGNVYGEGSVVFGDGMTSESYGTNNNEIIIKAIQEWNDITDDENKIGINSKERTIIINQFKNKNNYTIDDVLDWIQNDLEFNYEGGGFLGGIFGGGRTYKKGLAYKLDRAKHNKSEDWEVPMKNRKKRYGDGDIIGGGVGNIPNNYEGKSPKDIWDSWSKEQRKHFLYDHQSDARDSDEVGGSKGYYYSDDIDKWVEMEWNELPYAMIKNLVFEHTDSGQYAKGGGLKNNDKYAKGSTVKGEQQGYYIKPNLELRNEKFPYLVVGKEGAILFKAENKKEAELWVNERIQYAKGSTVKSNYVEVVLNEGSGKVINDLYNQWDNVKDDKQYVDWVKKVRETKFGTYGTISFKEILDRFNFDNAPINSFHLKTFKKELENALNKNKYAKGSTVKGLKIGDNVRFTKEFYDYQKGSGINRYGDTDYGISTIVWEDDTEKDSNGEFYVTLSNGFTVPKKWLVKTNEKLGGITDIQRNVSDGQEDYDYANGGGVEQVMTDEMCVMQGCVNGEIHCDMLEEIIGSKPEYPYQQVGSIRLKKCYLRPYYKIS